MKVIEKGFNSKTIAEKRHKHYYISDGRPVSLTYFDIAANLKLP
jgi:hypothetical protein